MTYPFDNTNDTKNPPENQGKKLQEQNLSTEYKNRFWHALLPLPREHFKEIIKAGGRKAGKLLFLHMTYMEVREEKETSTPWATNGYMVNRLGWAEMTVKEHKRKLKELGLIRTKVIKDKGGKIVRHIIEIREPGREETEGEKQKDKYLTREEYLNEGQEEEKQVWIPDIEYVDQYWESLLPLPRRTFIGIAKIGGKNAGNLLLLYMTYMEICREQGTNAPWATNKYIMKRLRWSDTTIKKYKRTLRRMGLIMTLGMRDRKGRIMKPFTLVKGMGKREIEEKTRGLKNPPVDEDIRLVYSPTNALTTKQESIKRSTGNKSQKNKKNHQLDESLPERELGSAYKIAKRLGIQDKDLGHLIRLGPGNVIDCLEKMEEQKEKGTIYKNATAYLNKCVHNQVKAYRILSGKECKGTD